MNLDAPLCGEYDDVTRILQDIHCLWFETKIRISAVKSAKKPTEKTNGFGIIAGLVCSEILSILKLRS